MTKEIARKLGDDGVVVYAVHIAESEPPDAIVNITSITGGEVFNPGDTDGLKRVFQAIDEMQETRVEKSRAEPIDNFAPWCEIALCLLGVSTLLLVGLRYTPW